MDERIIDRRSLLAFGGGLMLPLGACGSLGTVIRRPLRIGLIADLHHGLDPRAQERLEAFLAAADSERADMIVQLGDFNFAANSNRPCMQAWNQWRGPSYHVLGNHDMDKFGKEHVLDFWQMPARHYSFDVGDYHFVVLDRNHVRDGEIYLPYAKGNYFRAKGERSHADPEQLEWLAEDLQRATRPTVVFVHQGLGVPDIRGRRAESAMRIENVLARANKESETKGAGSKVIACFCGHHHLDRHAYRDGIHYVWINSASYYWVGGKYGRMAPYADPVFAFAELHDDHLAIRGRGSTFVSPTPEERGFPRWRQVSARQSDRRLDHTT